MEEDTYAEYKKLHIKTIKLNDEQTHENHIYETKLPKNESEKNESESMRREEMGETYDYESETEQT